MRGASLSLIRKIEKEKKEEYVCVFVCEFSTVALRRCFISLKRKGRYSNVFVSIWCSFTILPMMVGLITAFAIPSVSG